MSNPEPDADRNTRIMKEFRANGGRVERVGDGPPLRYLILHTVGAKSGQAREHPLAYYPVGEGFAVFASYGARPMNPGWYHNLVANPDVRIEVGTETLDVRARVLQGDERDAIWSKQKAHAPVFADYEAKTARTIPVVLLERRP